MNNKENKYIGKINGTYNDEVRSYGYEPLEDVLSSCDIYHCKTIDGYQFMLRLTSIRKGCTPNLFGVVNKFAELNLNKRLEADNIVVDMFKGSKSILKCNFCQSTWICYGTMYFCSRCKGTKLNVLDLNYYKSKLYESNKDTKILDLYRDNENKLRIDYVCKYCGKINYGELASKLQSSRYGGCNSCRNERIGMNQPHRIDFQDILKLAKDINPNIKINTTIKEYKNTATPMKSECAVCGHGEDGNWAISFDNLRNGRGCPKCANENLINDGGYNHTTAMRNKSEWSNTQAYVYIIELKSADENFYKIGITKQKTIRARFREMSSKYKLSIIKLISTSLYDAIKIERELHEMNESRSYCPNIKFGGYTECFIDIDFYDIENYINENKLELETP